ncbi:MAG: hypothetical protein OHK006_12440 [Thermodesulfovibrionales bacterium]
MLTGQSRSLSRSILVLLFFSFIFLHFMKPLTDPDMPWHLKTGEYILAQGKIPETDPFSFDRDQLPFIGHFVLSQYWLAQVLFYAVYKYLGPPGLMIAAAAIFTLIFLSLYAGIRRIGLYASLAVLGSAGVFILGDFIAVRPQVLTFLFTAAVLFLVESYSERGDKRFIIPIPFLMLLWANMHGGFIFGIMLLGIYLVSSFVSTALNTRRGNLLQEQMPRACLPAFAGIVGLSYALSLLNPNGYHAFSYSFAIHSKPVFEMIREYKSPLSILKQSPPLMIYCYWASIPFVAVLSLVFIRDRLLTPLMLVLFSLGLSFMGLRYISLFSIVLIAMLRHVPLPSAPALTDRITSTINAVLAVVLLVLVIVTAGKFSAPDFFRLSPGVAYPVQAADFLLQNNIRGNVFSSYNKSAYLIFRLFPASKIYADSRIISEQRLATLCAISGTFDPMKSRLDALNALLPPGIKKMVIPGDSPSEAPPFTMPDGDWKSLLDRIQADIIVHEAVNYVTGDIYPLTLKIIPDKDWVLIYLDGSTMIFVRNSDKNKDVISRFSMPKSAVYEEIFKESVPNLGGNTAQFYANIALARLLTGQADEITGKLIMTAQQLEPNNVMADYASVFLSQLTAVNAKTK